MTMGQRLEGLQQGSIPFLAHMDFIIFADMYGVMISQETLQNLLSSNFLEWQ